MIRKRFLDFKIIIPILLFFMISILSIKSASIYTSKSLGNLVLKQSIWYLVGISLVIAILYLKNEFFYRYSTIFYIIGNVFLLLLLFFGTPINNSRCWFTIPVVGSFQPSEFMKIFIMLILASSIKKYRLRYLNPTIFQEFMFLVKTFVIVLIPSILTFLEPDTGAVIIYFIIYFVMLLISGIRIRWFFCLGGIVLLGLAVVFGLYFFNSDFFIKMFGTKLFYRLDRIFAWKNGTGLQLENAIASIGSSGIIGYGFNKTPIYFPESSTDFIFAVYASNFGFILSLIFVLLICFFDLYIIFLMKKKIDLRDKFILSGISSCLIFQQVQNIGMTIGLFPIAGITLPFISYGGSSLLSYMIMIGIVLNITRNKELKYVHEQKF